METRLLTYADLGESLGITADSAKRLARRRGWTKQPGNDGRARVSVPVERLVPRAVPEDDPEDDREDIPEDVREDDPGERGAVIAALHRLIETLEQELAAVRSSRDAEITTLRADRDAERDRANALHGDAAAAPGLRTALDALKGALEAERTRAADVRAERDRLLRQLEERSRRSWWPFRRAV